MDTQIVSNADICGGVPCIQNTRIPVHIILSHLAAGENKAEILENFPELTFESIQACLEYASFLATEAVSPA